MDSKIRFSAWIEKIAAGGEAEKEEDNPVDSIKKLTEKSTAAATKVNNKMGITTKLDKLFK